MSDEPDIDDGIITCWCGAKGTYAELFDDDGIDDCCGGSGTIQCYCGGDICFCHHHGEFSCPGCEDCEPDEDDYYDDYDEDD